IDWAFLEHPYHAFAHPDYPPLVPLDYVFLALQRGAWDDRHLGLLTTLFAAALLFLVRDAFADELPPFLASLATFGVASLALTQWIGMAEAPFIAYSTSALLMLRRGSTNLGIALLGFAALTKNEGLALLVAVLIVRPRVWPAIAIPAPWLVLRTVHALPTDLASGDVVARAFRQFGDVLQVMATTPLHHALFWIAAVIAVVFFARKEKFVLSVLALQLLFYIAAFAVTPNDVHWHIADSWPRLAEHFAVPLGFMALLGCGHYFSPSGGILWTAVVGSGTKLSIERQ
ncbi:MAG TPA: hypothetical protein VJZ00_17010, partial [Thermoanaerobaculia bacterium]|nr:hypothetical protein [Thermoanaerobaculia bacterium]